MKQLFFTDKFMKALGRSYLVPCMLWGKEDEEFYAKNILPPFKRFMKDLLPRLKKCDGSVNDNINEILITCDNRNLFALPNGETAEIAAVITQKRVVDGQYIPGMIFGFTPKKIILAGGIFGLDSLRAERLRSYVEEEQERLALLVDNEEFAESFGREGFCRPAHPCSFDANTNELIVSRNFAGCVGEIPARFITDDILPDIIIAHYKGIKAVNRFLGRAFRPAKAAYEISV